MFLPVWLPVQRPSNTNVSPQVNIKLYDSAVSGRKVKLHFSKTTVAHSVLQGHTCGHVFISAEGGHHDTLSHSFVWKVLFSTMSTMLFLSFIQICLYLVMSTPVLPLSDSSYHVLNTYVLPTVVPGTSKM